jgi:hypothetical protein
MLGEIRHGQGKGARPDDVNPDFSREADPARKKSKLTSGDPSFAHRPQRRPPRSAQGAVKNGELGDQT